MERRDQYELDGSAPELYQRYLVPAVTALWAADLLARTCPRAGERCWMWRVVQVLSRVRLRSRLARVDLSRQSM
jgi:hypothetical protein